MRALTILTSAVAVAATSLGAVAVSGPAGAAPDDVVLKGHVVDTSGNPLQGIAVHCDIDGTGPFIVAGTDADGNYSVTRKEIDDRVDNDPQSGFGCEYLNFLDPEGRYLTTSWPSGDGPYHGYPLEFPPRDGGEPTIANGRLGAAGQIVGTATDAKKRGLYNVDVWVLSAKTRGLVGRVRTSPYGGYRVMSLRPGKYKVKIGDKISDIGYRPAYAGGGSRFEAAKTFTVKAGATTSVGRQTMPNTEKLFTSRGAPVLTYERPLVPGTEVTSSTSSYSATPEPTKTRFVVASRAVDPRTGAADDTLPYAASIWDYVLGDDQQPLVLTNGAYSGIGQGFPFQPFAGRRFVVVVLQYRAGYARASSVSVPTAIAQPAPPPAM